MKFHPSWSYKDCIRALLERKQNLMLEWEELQKESGISLGTLMRMKRSLKEENDLWPRVATLKKIKAFLEKTEGI